jgi:RimJ/RimL family protein N-acetyltransferase
MQHFLPNGQVLLVRAALLEDAPALLALFRQLTTETDFLLMTRQEAADLTVADEQAFISSLSNQSRHLHLLAVVENRLTGSITVKQSDLKKEAHLGQLGIAILHEYWNMGIGRRLMTTAMRWAEQHAELEFLHLSVLANNERAIQLYRNFGFLEYGRLQQGYKQTDGTYGDTILMSKRTRNG